LRLNINLTDDNRKELEYLNMLYPNLGVAYHLKEMFLDIFQTKDSEEAKYDLCSWCELAIESHSALYKVCRFAERYCKLF